MSTDLPRIGSVVPAHAAPRSSAVEWFTDRCVASAARRWPLDLSEAMAHEWHAELAALRVDRSMSGARRVWRSIRFATSLATSPPVEPPGSAPAGWRERVSGLGGTATAAVGFLGVALLAVALPSQANSGFANIDEHFSSTVVNIIVAVMLAVATGAMGWIGTVVGRGRRAGHSPLLVSLYAAVAVGAALVLVMGVQGGFYGPAWRSVGAMAVVWIVAITAAGTIAARFRAAGHRTAAWVSGVIGGLIAADLASIAAAARVAPQVKVGWGSALAWFPLSFLPDGTVGFGHYYSSGVISFGNRSISGPGQYGSSVLLDVVATVAGPLLLCSAFVIARSIRAAAPLVDAPVRAAATEALPRSARAVLLTRLVAAVGLLIGTAVWAYSSEQSVDSQLDRRFEILEFTATPWLHVVAIGLVCAALGLLLAGRATVGVTMVIAFVVLFGTDCLVMNAGAHGALIVAPIVLVSAATIAGGWCLAPRLARPDIHADGTRRALIGISVFAALAVMTAADLSSTVDSVPAAVTYALDAALWCVAVTAALASRRAPFGRLATAAYVVLPLIVLMLFVDGTAADALYYPRATFFIQAPLAIVVLAAVRWSASGGRIRPIVTWLLAGLGAAVVSVPLSDVVAGNGALLTSLLANLEYGPVAPLMRHGGSTVAGQLLLALAAAVLCAWWTVPPTAPAATVSAPEPEDLPRVAAGVAT